MANDLAKQPLLPALLDPTHQLLKNVTAKKKRFLRCRSTPPEDFTLESIRHGASFPDLKLIFSNFRPSFKQVSLFLVIYLGAGVVCFYLVKDQIKGEKTNGILDAIYFCIVTMTTVGYGDLVPNSVTTKLLACAFVFTGMAIGALLLSTAADYLVEKQEALIIKALHMRCKHGQAHTLKEIETNRVKYKFYTTTLLLTVLVLIGTMFLLKVEKLNLVDAFYCVCSTITTLGYGDKSFSTKGGRVFAVFWIMTSTICLAQFFLYLAELNTQNRQKLLAKWVLTRRMTFMDLEAADLDDDGVVGNLAMVVVLDTYSAAEFIIYKLKEMGKITQEDIALVMEEFEELDVDQSDFVNFAIPVDVT
ncbi:Two pore potassium channel a [Cocos nucifera]|nr:Two pore potassium channel a [Cocos nucifera]